MIFSNFSGFYVVYWFIQCYWGGGGLNLSFILIKYFLKSEIYVAYKDVLDGKGDEDLELSASYEQT